MAHTGSPYENARMESFFKTLKYEEVYLCEYETMEDIENATTVIPVSGASFIIQDF